MIKAPFFAVIGASVLMAASAPAQTTGSPPATTKPEAQSQAGPADLCHELLAYADKKASEASKPSAGQQASTPAAAPLPRRDARESGTQGGGSVGPSSSADTSTQASAPPTLPVAPGASPEPATSPYASQSSGTAQTGGAEKPEEVKLAGGMALQQVRDTANGGDRQACRDTAQKLRHAGADLPAALIALAAYEPDPAKRQ